MVLGVMAWSHDYWVDFVPVAKLWDVTSDSNTLVMVQSSMEYGKLNFDGLPDVVDFNKFCGQGVVSLIAYIMCFIIVMCMMASVSMRVH